VYQKAASGTQKSANLGRKCIRMRLVSPDPLGELERSPRPSSRNWGMPTSKGKEGEGGKGKDQTLFLGPD